MQTEKEISTLLDHDPQIIKVGRGIVVAGFVLGMSIAAKGMHDMNMVEVVAGYGTTASGLLPAYMYMMHKENQLRQEPVQE